MEQFKEALVSKYLRGFYNGLVGDTIATEEFKNRGFQHSFAIVKGRLVDDTEAMLSEWRKNTNEGGKSSPLPVALLGVGKDYTPSTSEYARQKGDHEIIKLPHNGELREMRCAVGDRRIQVVFVAAEEPTARSLAIQFCLYASAFKNRRFYSDYEIEGETYQMPNVLETPETLASNISTGNVNLTVLAVDLTFRETVPFVGKPLAGISQVESVDNSTGSTNTVGS